MLQPFPEAKFVTFYSCKGGVGRSMALVNVAGILAGRGFRVLAMDMDLEAPGISYLMRGAGDEANQYAAARTPGIVDLLLEARQTGEEAALFAKTPVEVIEEHSYPYSVPAAIRPHQDGVLRIMPAGRLDDDYQHRLDQLALGQLYLDGYGKPLIDTFKRVIIDSQRFDFVLVDSRTGFSDEAGICTRDLADVLVVVMGLNRQNVEGSAEFFRSLRAAKIDKPLRIVLSPVPTGEDELFVQREAAAQAALTEVLGGQADLSLQIPYHPRLALSEELRVVRRSNGALDLAYVALERAVLGLANLTGEALASRIENCTHEGMAVNIAEVARDVWLLARVEPDRAASLLQPEYLNRLVVRLDAGPLRDVLLNELPADAWVHRTIANRLSASIPGEAVRFLRQAVQGAPEFYALRVSLAWRLCDAGDLNGAETEFRVVEQVEPLHPRNSSFAVFLGLYRKDYANAHSRFNDLRIRHPQNDEVTSDYATFLGQALGRIDEAIALFEGVLRAAPMMNSAPANLAGLLFRRGRTVEGARALNRALFLSTRELHGSLLSELHFYAYAHVADLRVDALAALQVLIRQGVRAFNWDLTDNVRAAREAGHPAPEFLAALAKVVSNEAKIETLDAFPEWPKP